MKSHVVSALLLSAVFVFVAGCGGAGPDLCKVKGTLTYKGKPMPKVYVRFEPDDLATKSTSMAVTDDNGKFEMFIGSTPGVFRGKVKVYCDDPQAAMGGQTPMPAEIEPAYRELCEKYGDGKSTYEMTIEKSNSNFRLALE